MGIYRGLCCISPIDARKINVSEYGATHANDGEATMNGVHNRPAKELLRAALHGDVQKCRDLITSGCSANADRKVCGMTS